jgi:hypothetical protein
VPIDDFAAEGRAPVGITASSLRLGRPLGVRGARVESRTIAGLFHEERSMSRTETKRTARPALWCAALLLCLLPIGDALAAPPTVNGLFYGDGDDGRYVHWATSLLGSKLYVYVDVPSTTLYVALVVDRSVNDNVFGDSHAGFSGNYMSSAGWGVGRGQQRPASRLVDSEFASFEFACAPNTANRWAWQQGYACLQGGTWTSDSTSCGTSAVLYQRLSRRAGSSAPAPSPRTSTPGTPRRSSRGTSTSSAPRSTSGSRRSRASDPNTSPPNNPNTVIGLEGYPASGQIGFNSTYQYEWPMVYEWSIDVGPNGTNCGDQALFLITGESHHSPMKDLLGGQRPLPGGDDCFPPGGDTNPFSDWGDLPNSYGTTSASNGPRHYIKVNGPRLGQDIQAETSGQPTADATGDGAEEDGVTANVTSNWTAGSTQTIEVTVSNAPSGALLGAWFDWNGDGDVADAGEFFSWNVVNGTNTQSLTVGAGFDWQSDTLYARFRIFSSGAAAPGGTLTQADSVGVATDGEVEDYAFQPGELPVTLNAFTSEGSPGGELTVRWQTASETDNVAFELWGRVGGEWQPLTELVQSQGMSSALPQSYEVRIAAPAGLGALQLVDYDSRGRTERFGAFRVGESYGEIQRARPIDWRGPRAERAERLRDLGFVDTAREEARRPCARRGVEPPTSRAARWKKLGAASRSRAGYPVPRGFGHHGRRPTGAAPWRRPRRRADVLRRDPVETGAMTHVAVTEAGVQRVTYEALRDGGLDLAGVHTGTIAVTWRGAPVDRWIDGPPSFGPGSAIEFVGRPPAGDDALYIDANLYQVAVDPSLAREPATLGQGKAKSVSPPILREASWWTGPWPTTPVADRRPVGRAQRPGAGGTADDRDARPPGRGPGGERPEPRVVGLGTVTDLPDLRDGSGRADPGAQRGGLVRAGRAPASRT